MQRKIEKTSKLESLIQANLRLFLKSYRLDRNLTQQDLADELNMSKSLICKFESKNPVEITTPVSSYLQLAKIGGLRGLPPDSFCSILSGKRNEEGEEGGSFAKDIAKNIQSLGNIAQVDLKEALKEIDGFNISTKTILDVVRASPIRRKLYQAIQKLNESQTKAVFDLLDSFMVK